MKEENSIAIMQPYLFPYIGYFQLINAVDKFVIYDDVQYIKRGWINRNRILLNGTDYLFTIPISKSSQNKLIYEISPIITDAWKSKFFLSIAHAYKKAPYYDCVVSILMNVFDKKDISVTDLCVKSIKLILEYLGLNFKYLKSSELLNTNNLENKADRLINIAISENSKVYINPIGGDKLYKKEYFKTKGIELKFLESKVTVYKQFNNEFIPNLSIIDVLMFNSIKDTKILLTKYIIA